MSERAGCWFRAPQPLVCRQAAWGQGNDRQSCLAHCPMKHCSRGHQRTQCRMIPWRLFPWWSWEKALKPLHKLAQPALQTRMLTPKVRVGGQSWVPHPLPRLTSSLRS